MLYLAIIHLTFITNINAEELSQLEYLTESYPPNNYIKEGKLEGISVDLLLASMASLNEPLDISQIQLLPWSRGYMMVNSRKNRVLFSMTRTPAREKLFSWVGPITTTRVVLFSRQQDKIVIDDIDSLNKYTIGVIRGDVGESLLISSGVNDKQLIRVNNVTSLFKMLNLGRIDLFSYEENAGRWFIKETKLNTEDFKVVHTLQESDLYFAVSLGTQQKLIDKLQLAVENVKKNTLENGKTQYEMIMEKYK
ncbi:transporter substrate-binding domain-containing protein [Shewanella sp. VB17]|nr:transporter substrate-binding domain-containing protein [Shewanella sp. VB17]